MISTPRTHVHTREQHHYQSSSSLYFIGFQQSAVILMFMITMWHVVVAVVIVAMIADSLLFHYTRGGIFQVFKMYKFDKSNWGEIIIIFPTKKKKKTKKKKILFPLHQSLFIILTSLSNSF